MLVKPEPGDDRRDWHLEEDDERNHNGRDSLQRHVKERVAEELGTDKEPNRQEPLLVCEVKEIYSTAERDDDRDQRA